MTRRRIAEVGAIGLVMVILTAEQASAGRLTRTLVGIGVALGNFIARFL